MTLHKVLPGQGRRGMLRLGWVVVLVLMAAAAPVMGAEKRAGGILVWQLQKKQGVSAEEIDSISGFITSEVERNSGQRVVSEADIETLLQGEQKKQQCGDDSATCVAEIGAALGVPEVVAGDLGRVGSFWFFNIRRINVRKAEVIKRVSRRVQGDINALIEVLPGALAELFGKSEDGAALTATPPTSETATAKPAATPPTASKPTTTTAKQVPPETARPEAAAAKSVAAKRPLRTAGYAVFFPGLALAGLGGVGLWQADAANGDDRAKFDAWKAVSIAGFAVGGAAMATGIVLWIIDAVQAKPAPSKTAADHVGVQVRDGGAAVFVQGRW